MKMDFLTRFKGRTSTMNKSEGITGIIKASGTPVEKLHATEKNMKCCLSQTNSYAVLDQDRLSEYSYQGNQNPKIITNIGYPYTRKFSLGTPLKPIQNSNPRLNINPPEIKKPENYNLPLSKTANFNVNDFEYVMIPKEMLYRIKLTDCDQKQPKPDPPRMIKSQILNSYAEQNQRKRSLLQAGLNAIQC